jgi:iron(III) transport system substrate-binding protein
VRFLTALLVLAMLFGAVSSAPAADPNAAFNALVAAAKAEGTIVVNGPPNDAVRDAVTTGFEKAYGITVNYLGTPSSEAAARLRAERASGKYLLDVALSGSDTPVLTFLPNGWLDRIEPALIEPDVINKKNWKDGHIWYVDPQHTIIRVLQDVQPELAINTKLVSAKEIPTWKSLLDPKWKGKLLAKDPTTGSSGQSLTSYLYVTFGGDFIHKLYKDQNPTLVANPRQGAQFLAQGNYGVWVGCDFSQLAPFIKQGYPIEAVEPSDGPGILSGEFGMINLMNKAPHPNAAKLFVNWIASKEGETLFARAEQAASLRTDVDPTWMMAVQLPRPGRKYYDEYDYNYIKNVRATALVKVQEILGF